MRLSYVIKGGDFSAGGHASSVVKKTLKHLNIQPSILRRIAIALYEAEMNVVAHAYNGVMEVDLEANWIKVVIEDNGPGIANIERAMEEGFSTATEKVRQMGFGAGMGLPNIKKNSDVMHLESTLGKGTKLELRIYFNDAEK